VRLNVHPQNTSRMFGVSPSERVTWVSYVPKYRCSRQPRQQLFKYLNTFCAEFRINNRKSGHIPARVSQARDQPALHGVNGVGVDDWPSLAGARMESGIVNETSPPL